jgi:hypothetical protein
MHALLIIFFLSPTCVHSWPKSRVDTGGELPGMPQISWSDVAYPDARMRVYEFATSVRVAVIRDNSR